MSFQTFLLKESGALPSHGGNMNDFRILLALVGFAAGLFLTPVPNNPSYFVGRCQPPLYIYQGDTTGLADEFCAAN
jgi:hypothetical protein